MKKGLPPKKNQPLRANSTLFFQLGLLLCLVIVYQVINIPLERKVVEMIPFATETEEEFVVQVPSVTMEEKKEFYEVVKKQQEPKIVDLSQIETAEETNDEPELFSKEEPEIISLDEIDEFIEVPKEEEIPFVLVEQAPRFPGCKEKSEEAYKKCFNRKLQKFVAKEFRSVNAHSSSGRQRVAVRFQIDATGKIVNIQARAPHKSWEKEAIRTIKKLPQMKPGKQRNIPVSVTYVLPILIELP